MIPKYGTAPSRVVFAQLGQMAGMLGMGPRVREDDVIKVGIAITNAPYPPNDVFSRQQGPMPSTLSMDPRVRGDDVVQGEARPPMRYSSPTRYR